MVKQSQVRRHLVAVGGIMVAAKLLYPAVIAWREQGGDDDRPGQISTWLPSSTTGFGGSLKNSIALSALRSIQEKSFSRHSAIPGREEEESRVWRARKKLVSIILNCGPQPSSRVSSRGTSTSSMKP